MNVWLVMSGEPLEMFGERPHRIGLLSKILVGAGHQVTWWTTTFEHQHKKYLFNENTQIKSDFGVNMFFLHSTTKYLKNISLQRILNHYQVSRSFAHEAQKLDKPDIILCCYPTIDLAFEATTYGKKHRIPVVLDVRDLWPNIFVDAVPKALHFLTHALLTPLYRKAKASFQNAYGITGMTDEFVQFGLDYAEREKKGGDRGFPFAYPDVTISDEQRRELYCKLNAFGLDKDDFIACFFGTVGYQFDFQTVIDAAKILKDQNIQIVICGTGDMLEPLKKRTQGIPNLLFLGWLSQAEMCALMEIASVGLAPYMNKKDFLSSLPNKVVEYFSGGLPVLSSIGGVSGRMIKENGCGMIYGQSSDDLAKKLLLLRAEPQLQQQMSKASRVLYEERFSADKVYADMMNYLGSVIDSYRMENK